MKHNKKRNGILLYNFLVRHISNSMLDENKKESNKALNIIKKHYRKNSELLKELNCMKAIVNTTSLKSQSSARSVLNEVYKDVKKINYDKLDNEKSKLIKDINHNLGKNVYEYKIPNYKIAATTHLLFKNIKNKKNLLESVEKVKYEDAAIEHLTSKNSNNQFNPLKVNPKYNNTVYNLVVKKFNEKYSEKLNEDQQKVLKDYILYLITEDDSKVKKAINENVSRIKGTLKNVRDESIVSDSDLMKKLNECYKRVVTTDFHKINEENMFSLLQFMRLMNEVKSKS